MTDKIDEKILKVLKKDGGRLTPSIIAKRLGSSNAYVWQRLKVMTLKGAGVRQVDKGLYEATNHGE